MINSNTFCLVWCLLAVDEEGEIIIRERIDHEPTVLFLPDARAFSPVDRSPLRGFGAFLARSAVYSSHVRLHSLPHVEQTAVISVGNTCCCVRLIEVRRKLYYCHVGNCTLFLLYPLKISEKYAHPMSRAASNVRLLTCK